MSMSGSFTPGKPVDTAAKRIDAASAEKPTTATVGAGVRAGTAPGGGVRSVTSLNATPIPQRMIKCPKCAADAREVARFCPRCHATLRFECPACKHEQRKGGSCEKCGVNFAKYITAVVAAKKVEADQVHDRIERRTGIIKQVFLLPITGGLSLFKYFFQQSKK
jgi:predicted amidophosphoribosyltransferase